MKKGTGRCAILFPHGVLFRNEELDMRRRIVEADVVDCVLGLGPGLFYNSPMEACVLFCCANKPPERRGKVFFINAVNEYDREYGQSLLKEIHIDRILTAYRTMTAEAGFSRPVAVEEVLRNGASLSIPLYVEQSEGSSDQAVISSRQAAEAWEANIGSCRQLIEDFAALATESNN
jgi:type I restriction enzyme M protein